MADTTKPNATQEHEVAEYVYFDAKDCAGYIRRIVATAVDLLVLLAIWVAYAVALDLSGALPLEEDPPGWSLAGIAVIAFLYLTALKRSRIPTPGYWVTGLRIVNLKGQTPSMFFMSLRLIWWAFGPIGPLVDLAFLSNNTRCQPIRDLLFGTYVIKRGATPAGCGTKTMGSTSFMAFMPIYPVVLSSQTAPGGTNA